MKKGISLFLVIVFCISLITISVYATNDNIEKSKDISLIKVIKVNDENNMMNRTKNNSTNEKKVKVKSISGESILIENSSIEKIKNNDFNKQNKKEKSLEIAKRKFINEKKVPEYDNVIEGKLLLPENEDINKLVKDFDNKKIKITQLQNVVKFEDGEEITVGMYCKNNIINEKNIELLKNMTQEVLKKDMPQKAKSAKIKLSNMTIVGKKDSIRSVVGGEE